MGVIRLNCCRRCKHGEAVPGSPEIECRRYPPTLTALLVPAAGAAPKGALGIHMQTAFPRVAPDLYCSEWGAKLATAADAFAPIPQLGPATAMAS